MSDLVERTKRMMITRKKERVEKMVHALVSGQGLQVHAPNTIVILAQDIVEAIDKGFEND